MHTRCLAEKMETTHQVEIASEEDAKEILVLQKLAYYSEAELHNDFNIPPLHQSLSEVKKEIEENVVLKICEMGQIVGSVRGGQKEGICYIGKLIVSPDFQNKGMGSLLLTTIENHFPDVEKFELFTGYLSKKNIGMYERRGYRIFDRTPHLVFMGKSNQNKASKKSIEDIC